MKHETIYVLFGKRIKDRRNEIGWTQQELADNIKLTRTSVANIESGAQRVQLHTLYELAAILDINPVDLLPKPKIQKTVTFTWPEEK